MIYLCAKHRDDMNIVRAPIENPRDSLDELERSKLHYAANNGSSLLVLQLINDGIDINAQDAIGWTPLHFAAQNSHFAIIDLLLEYNANPNLHDKQGNGPLWIAAMSILKSSHGVESLLKTGANPDHKNHHGRTPFYIANTIKKELKEVFEFYTDLNKKKECL